MPWSWSAVLAAQLIIQGGAGMIRSVRGANVPGSVFADEHSQNLGDVGRSAREFLATRSKA
ncbi:hypothetical protein AS594_33610 [Streptomyces agglomeratus]|uniref:Uncharacterized protein n=1 Tax=Streptomyces agglomeratus TaxID=285458 RepID=A0A1E5PGN4_9ACTN|nr:hypothetical protein AS594_33610 [Streptomyces agglomeratus]OEJ49800.1 hypothetical protein BGK72_02450 [Streptomyces agglomeratus]